MRKGWDAASARAISQALRSRSRRRLAVEVILVSFEIGGPAAEALVAEARARLPRKLRLWWDRACGCAHCRKETG